MIVNREQALSMVEARDRLTRLPEEFNQIVKNRDGVPVVKVTRRNKPVLAILSWELYEAIMETLEVLSDDEQMMALRQAIQEVAQGQGKPWNTVRGELGWDEPDSFQSAPDLRK
jgi:antitoxin YefM